MSYPSSSDNAAILASALTSLTGSPVITLSDYLNQRVNENNLNYQNINPVSLDSLHNSYLSGGAVPTNSTNSQQNNDNPNSISCSSSYDHYYWPYFNLMYPQQDTLQDTPQQIPQHQIPRQIPHPIPLPHQIPRPIPHPPHHPIPYHQIPYHQIPHHHIPTHHQIPYHQIPYPPRQIMPYFTDSMTSSLHQRIPQRLQTSENPTITIIVKTLNGQTIQINDVLMNAKISDIKFNIECEIKIPSNQQRLVYAGIVLKDDSTLSDYDIVDNNSTIYLIGDVTSFIDSNFLDPKYDYDFTNVNDDKQFMRGSHIYRRPCGWKRIAVKVLNKYGPDNTWLGPIRRGSRRYESDPMEWPVSYHGTDKFNAKSIAETGFDITKGKRFKFGHGIYSTPDIKIAAKYAKKFVHNNKIYSLVFQNRVNPNTLVKIDTKYGEYWISPKSDDIRPYGICIKKLSKKRKGSEII